MLLFLSDLWGLYQTCCFISWQVWCILGIFSGFLEIFYALDRVVPHVKTWEEYFSCLNVLILFVCFFTINKIIQWGSKSVNKHATKVYVMCGEKGTLSFTFILDICYMIGPNLFAICFLLCFVLYLKVPVDEAFIFQF